MTEKIPPKLVIELVPGTSWGDNLRKRLPARLWDILRKKQYRIAKWVCEICGGKGPRYPVECHEVWHYDDVECVQTLVRLIALCPDCHMVKHIGLAQVKGQEERALHHLMKINNWTQVQAQNHVNHAFLQWQERSHFDWSVDISALKENS